MLPTSSIGSSIELICIQGGLVLCNVAVHPVQPHFSGSIPGFLEAKSASQGPLVSIDWHAIDIIVPRPTNLPIIDINENEPD